MDIQHHQFANPVGNNPAWILYKSFGDSTYGHMECIQSRHRVAGVLQENLRMENVAMSRERESIEWSYGETSNLFPFVNYEKRQQLLASPVVESYITATIISNCYATLNHNSTSKFFIATHPRLNHGCANCNNQIYLRNLFLFHRI